MHKRAWGFRVECVSVFCAPLGQGACFRNSVTSEGSAVNHRSFLLFYKSGSKNKGPTDNFRLYGWWIAAFGPGSAAGRCVWAIYLWAFIKRISRCRLHAVRNNRDTIFNCDALPLHDNDVGGWCVSTCMMHFKSLTHREPLKDGAQTMFLYGLMTL